MLSMHLPIHINTNIVLWQTLYKKVPHFKENLSVIVLNMLNITIKPAALLFNPCSQNQDP